MASVTTTFKDREVRRLILEFPKVVNQDQNRAFRKAATSFMRDFATSQLTGVGAPFRVRKKRPLKKLNRFQPNIGKTARRAGFLATIHRQKSIEKKALSISTRNPALIIRERGGTIEPRRKTHLFIRGDINKAFKGKRGAKKKREALASRLGTDRFGRQVEPIIAKVKSVFIPARLQFESRWGGATPKTVSILDDAIRESVRRANLARGRRR